MVITDYIKSKFRTFGIEMSEADLLDVWTNDDADITADNKTEVEIAIAGFIPQLMIRPTSVSEGDYRVSFDVQAVKDYYAFLCKKYDLIDLLNSKNQSDISVISDASEMW